MTDDNSTIDREELAGETYAISMTVLDYSISMGVLLSGATVLDEEESSSIQRLATNLWEAGFEQGAVEEYELSLDFGDTMVLLNSLAFTFAEGKDIAPVNTVSGNVVRNIFQQIPPNAQQYVEDELRSLGYNGPLHDIPGNGRGGR